MFKKHFKIIKEERVTGTLPYRILERYTMLFFIHWWSTPAFAPPHLHQTYKEDDDERIKKELIQWVDEFPDIIWRGHYKKDIIDWIEKQGEPNPYSGVSFKYNGHTWGMCARDGGVEILVDGEIKESIKFAHI